MSPAPAGLLTVILIVVQFWTFYKGRKDPLPSRTGKMLALWSILIPVIALASAIALTVIVDTSINQLQSSVNAYVTAGYYRGLPALIL